MTPARGTILAKINSPNDLTNLSDSQLTQLAEELRSFILDVVSVHPGHLGSSLGVVELTIALHKVYNTPYDRIIWDVGHQAYGHKILTGRKNVFHTNRQHGGISGFPVRTESEYDSFGTGHASTSVSAALGMAEASRLKGEKDRKHIAVIGDGALTGGMAIEGMNNAGSTNADILIVLNDNGISIDKNVGSLKDYFASIAETGSYDVKKWKALGIAIKNVEKLSKSDNNIAGNFKQRSNLFEAMNFKYFGPVDGHDISVLTEVLSELKNIPGPKLLHVITKKGKGFKKAEEQQTLFHAPGKFNRKTGDIEKAKSSDVTSYQEVFGSTLLELADADSKVVAITPAMPTGSALTYMQKKFPDRVFDVGIAEQHAVTFAAGLAAEGFKPMCTIYSTFLQRAYDQIIHDVAIQKLPVVFCIDRAGLVGEDGQTHHGVFDLTYMRNIPGMVVSAPMDEVELRNLMYTSTLYTKGPFSIRYPRGTGFLNNWKLPFKEIEIGKGRKLISGKEIAIISIGKPGNFVTKAVEILNQKDIFPSHYDLRFLSPLDEKLVSEAFTNHKTVITIEDGVIKGGLGSVIHEFASRRKLHSNIITLGLPDKFIEHGDLNTLYDAYGLGVENIVNKVISIAESDNLT